MTFQVLGAGMISLGVAVGIACVFHVELMILTGAVVVDREGGGGGDSGDGE
jgi:hypothetical protein